MLNFDLIDCQSQICANSLFGEEEEGDSLYIRKLLSSSLHTYGGNLSVIPSQESPQIHAISPPSLRVSVVRSPLLYKTLVIHVLLRLSHKYLPMAVTTVGDLLNGLALTAKTCRHVLYGGAVVQNDGEDFSHIHGFQP